MFDISFKAWNILMLNQSLRVLKHEAVQFDREDVSIPVSPAWVMDKSW
jgi:hypothetical protein